MDKPAASPPSGDDEQTKRRGPFPGREHTTPPEALRGEAGRVEELMAAYQATIQRQLEEGMRRIQLTASSLMHEIASEVWRTAGGDKDQARSRILQEISRDQALRGLIAHSDDRFQALAIRTERLEDTLNHVAESVRAARQQFADGIGKLGEGGGGRDADELRAQLAEVTRQVAAALGTLAERDQAIVDTVRERVREHGEVITQETTRISAAMQAYVQHGVEAVGQLAGSMDAQIHALATRDHEIADRIGTTVEEQMRLLAEQLQLLYERMAIDTTSLTEAMTHHSDRNDERMRAVSEYLHLLGERVDVAARDGVDDMRRTLETRVMGLAQLVRSDAEALRAELVRTAEAIDEHTARALDERLGTVSVAVAEGTARILDEFGRRMQEDTAHAIRAWIDEALARLEAQSEEQSRRLESQSEEQSRRSDGRAEEALSAIDRNMVRMSDAIEGQFERLGQVVAERAAQASDVAIGERFDDVLARLHQATGSIEGMERVIVEGRIETEQAVDRSVEQRISSLARLIRSDNETLAQQIVADQEASKQSLRAMKELQANLPAEVIEMVEQRFASLAESIERSNEMLAKRIDHMAVKIGERYDNDIQVVVDRMGDAMHALASLGRPGATGGSATRVAEPRIELE